MLNTITTVLVGLLGVQALAKFVSFALPYRRRRAALDKSYGDKPSATITSDTVMLSPAKREVPPIHNCTDGAAAVARSRSGQFPWWRVDRRDADTAVLPRVPRPGRARPRGPAGRLADQVDVVRDSGFTLAAMA
jgi:hypothetical protein